MTHQLVKRSPGRVECRVCKQSWRRKPRSVCSGLPVYRYGEHIGLLNKTQLQRAGYRPYDDTLPAPVGCYYSFVSKKYIALYRPIPAMHRARRTSRRVHFCIAEIVWPLAFVSLLEAFSSDFDVTEQLIHDIANIAAQMLLFSHTEIEALSGRCIHLSFTPCMLQRLYASPQAREDEQYRLASRIADAYQAQRGDS